MGANKLAKRVMMNIDAALVKKLETLSKIELTDQKREEMGETLSEIVDFVENLSALDTDKIEGTFTTLQGGTPLREDSPKKGGVAEAVLKKAPQSEDGFFVVPKIIE